MTPWLLGAPLLALALWCALLTRLAVRARARHDAERRRVEELWRQLRAVQQDIGWADDLKRTQMIDWRRQ